MIAAEPERLIRGTPPIVIDEWQRFPSSWDLVRRAVDADPSPGRFLLTGSATLGRAAVHSGAGRIVPVRMRPLTLFERGVSSPTVSLRALLSGARPPLEGATEVALERYVDEMLTGGFPGMRGSGRAQRSALDGYLMRIVQIDLPELGVNIRNPSALLRWLRAYAAATATDTAYDRIRDASTAGESDKPAKATAIAYRDALERVWVADPLPAWLPTNNHLARLATSPKHHLADPALAARLVGADRDSLLAGEGPALVPRDGTFLGALFESQAALDVRVFAQAAEATVGHLRDRNGRHEIDLVVARSDQRIVAIEVKLSATIEDSDVRHLRWLREQLGPALLDAIVLSTGTEAYRRSDGIGVVSLALLGP